ncbi:hypothetical protein [Nocardioides sp. GXQ0305]|uniref:hypothetical protein n=1 Tax=Nocardioides sp. GXQ0305 TaxID=3423912 RepID=UPI003D7E660B
MGLAEAGVALAVALPFGLGLTAAAPDDDAPVLRFADPEIVESSGLVARDGLLQTVNDSGDEARVFTVDRSGRTVGVTRWAAAPVDVEALAPGPPGRVWVGDIGDNAEERDGVVVTSVPVGRGEVSGTVESYRLAYPDGATDAETLLAHPRTGRLYVVTKGVLGGEVLAAPRELDAEGVNRLRPVGRSLALATDGAFLPDGRHVVLRDYGRAVVYRFPSFTEVSEVPLPPQRQGEGLAVDDRGRLLVSSEGPRAPVYAVDLPPRVAPATAAEDEAGDRTPSASPSPEPLPEPAPDPASSARPDVRSWLIGAGILVAMVVVLLRSLRPR